MVRPSAQPFHSSAAGKEKFSPSAKNDRPLFYKGQRLRFPSQKNGNGPLVWGTVTSPKQTKVRIHPDGTPSKTKIKRSAVVLERINFPKGSPIGELIPIDSDLRETAVHARG